MRLIAGIRQLSLSYSHLTPSLGENRFELLAEPLTSRSSVLGQPIRRQRFWDPRLRGFDDTVPARNTQTDIPTTASYADAL